ncbi:hypothetical protein Ddc_13414 [Ditylenchus destructor]|nr:hypothetical protein Ddc_13414 [Ditylenchus destructor]
MEMDLSSGWEVLNEHPGCRLSPIIDSEDDCQQEDDSHLQKITLKYEVVDEFDIPPWIDSTDFPFNNPFRQKQPTNELGIQCRPAHGPMIDKHLQTTYIDYEDNSLQVEFKIEYPDCNYEESAENRILQCLSTMLYSNELVSWLSPYEKTENRVQKGISISPNCKDATKVIDSHASPEHFSSKKKYREIKERV